MYLLNVSYSKSPSEVEPHKATHGEWVKKYFDEELFLLAGPKKSGLGGIILAKGIDKKKLLAILAEDSYVKADVVDYQIVEFDCKITADDLSVLVNM